ncbi:MAG TPA: K(+)-transporting ATPase subunit C [Ferruginibacter sp.]|jgi:K+-transporting ATPase ATPase C chain|nr:K(+)-transporting ATPase subunit C [Ferruginibacter sp.]
MKQHILPALRLTLVSVFFFCVVYTLLIWGIAQAAPNKGQGETVTLNGKVVGYALEGQNFTQDKYFWSRPSKAGNGYDATSGSGSNKGPSNPDYLADVQNHIDSFMVHNPDVKKEDIPSELVTYSASGLDPDISTAAAYVQVARIAKIRNIGQDKIEALIVDNMQKPLFGFFGIEKINVLQLNIALDKLK